MTLKNTCDVYFCGFDCISTKFGIQPCWTELHNCVVNGQDGAKTCLGLGLPKLFEPGVHRRHFVHVH